MPLRLATFNVENLFERAKALNTTTWAREDQSCKPSTSSTSWPTRPATPMAISKQAMLAALETLKVLQRTPAGSQWLTIVLQVAEHALENSPNRSMLRAF